MLGKGAWNVTHWIPDILLTLFSKVRSKASQQVRTFPYVAGASANMAFAKLS